MGGTVMSKVTDIRNAGMAMLRIYEDGEVKVHVPDMVEGQEFVAEHVAYVAACGALWQFETARTYIIDMCREVLMDKESSEPKIEVVQS